MDTARATPLEAQDDHSSLFDECTEGDPQWNPSRESAEPGVKRSGLLSSRIGSIHGENCVGSECVRGSRVGQRAHAAGVAFACKLVRRYVEIYACRGVHDARIYTRVYEACVHMRSIYVCILHVSRWRIVQLSTFSCAFSHSYAALCIHAHTYIRTCGYIHLC
jgi:hypothetical protein